MQSEEKIKQQYLDPSVPGSLGGLQRFLSENKRYGNSQFVLDTLKKLQTYSVHRPRKPVGKRRKVIVGGKNIILAADLADVQNWNPRINKGTKYLLIIVDIFSKFVSIYPIKNKSGAIVSKAFDEHFKKHPEQSNCKIWVDRGKEFISKLTQNILNKYGVSIYHTYNAKLKSVYAESFVKLVKLRIARLLTEKGNKKYFEELPKIENAMNNEKKRSTGFAPVEIKSFKEESLAWHRQFRSILDQRQRLPNFKLNDKVRIHKEKLLFSKVYKESWSDEIFYIAQIFKYHPLILYSIKDIQGSILPFKFYDFELLLIPPDNNNGNVK